MKLLQELSVLFLFHAKVFLRLLNKKQDLFVDYPASHEAVFWKEYYYSCFCKINLPIKNYSSYELFKFPLIK